MVEFKMYSGLHTVGGVIFTLTEGKERIIFEFGTAYNPATDVYDKYVKQRQYNQLFDALTIGAVPKIEGIYPKEKLNHYPLQAAEESDIHTSVFISHLHLDHMSCIHYLSKKVDIYMNNQCRKILDCLETTHQGIGFDHPTINFENEQTITIGNFKITPLISKKESFRDYSFFIETPEGSIHYTGDLILHHKEKENTYKELAYVKAKKPDILICDSCGFLDDVFKRCTKGTMQIVSSNVIPEGMQSEAEMHENLFNIISRQKGLCVINYYPREMFLANFLLECATKCHREMVFEPETAYLVSKFNNQKVNIYVPDDSYYHNNNETWYTELLKNNSVITTEEINAHPDQYLIQNEYSHIMELFSFTCKDKVYLHAEGTPIGAFDPAYQNLMKILKLAEFSYETCIYTTYFNHAYPNMAKYYVDEIDPPTLIPSHSYASERLLPNHGEQFFPEYEHSYKFTKGKLQ